jgi:hypothetical protein
MICKHCGKPESQHVPIAPASGGHFHGQSELICPTAIYTPKPAKKPGKKAR